MSLVRTTELLHPALEPPQGFPLKTAYLSHSLLRHDQGFHPSAAFTLPNPVAESSAAANTFFVIFRISLPE